MKAFVVSLTGLALVACGDVASNDNVHVPKVSEVAPSVPAPPKSLRLEDIDFTSYSEGMAIDNIRLYFAPDEGDNIIQTPQSTFDREDGAVMIFGASGLADDSVKAEEIFLILTGPEGAQKLQAFGSKIKCHRGDNTTEWQITNCP
jgi:hypothetical protein